MMGNLKNRYNRFLYKNSNRGIPNLAKGIVFAMSALIVVNIIFNMMNKPEFLNYFVFDRDSILAGEVWRIVAFIIYPPQVHLIFVIFALYLLWLMGTFLESYWGVFKLNLFYFSGVLFTIIGGFIAGTTTNIFLNLSIFLAFAIINPDFELRLFFFIPIKVKYLAIADAVVYLVFLFISSWPIKVAIIISLLNVFLFLGPTMYNGTKSFIQRRLNRKKWKKSMQNYKWR